MKKLMTSLSLLVLLSACSSSQTMTVQEKKAAYQQYITSQKITSVDKIRTFNYKDWQSLTDNYVMISTSLKRQYLVELKGMCTNLDFAHGITINQRNGSSLMTRFDSISPLSEPGIKCFIKKIHPLTREQEQAIKAIGKSSMS